MALMFQKLPKIFKLLQVGFIYFTLFTKWDLMSDYSIQVIKLKGLENLLAKYVDKPNKIKSTMGDTIMKLRTLSALVAAAALTLAACSNDDTKKDDKTTTTSSSTTETTESDSDTTDTMDDETTTTEEDETTTTEAE